jgi:ribosome-associated protein
MTTETAAKRDTQKLQRAIVDGLEDVKAQDIQVFDTEHLSSLFERVIVASGTSNRQTKALAASVRDAVREAGFPKPRIEGEANGEWIIVDCSQAVVHIMQPTFRSYYHLEELWGEKPVRLKFGASKPAVKAVAVKVPAGKAASAKPAAGKKVAGKPAAAGKAAASASKVPAKSAAVKSVSSRKPAAAKSAAAKSVPARKSPAAKKPVPKKVVIGKRPAPKA